MQLQVYLLVFPLLNIIDAKKFIVGLLPDKPVKDLDSVLDINLSR